jgi:Flp pilus assembly protein TadD
MRQLARLKPSRSIFICTALLAATAGGARGLRGADRSAPTYNADIAPLVNDRCAMCHHPGGSAPFSLLSYDEARRRASLIAAVTRRRYMPPWKVAPGFGPFVGQHPLSDAEIDLVQRWAAGGAPEGEVPAPRPTTTWTAGWQLGEPDLVITLGRPYTLPAEGTDVFRIFVLPIPVSARRYVRGLEFRPGNAKVVHHANIRVDRTTASRALDDADPAPGYSGLIPRSAEYPDGHFLGWTPGQIAPLLPDDLAWRLDPNTDLVVEVHMQPSGKPEQVQPSVGLYFGRRPPTRTPAMLRLGRQTIDIPAGERDYTITDSYRLPVDVEVEALQPHAHYRAREIRGDATLPDGTVKPLIAIADWDFRWQHVYRFVTPLPLPKGTVVSMRYTYDNSEDNPRNPERPPKHVRWGQRSSDEMGDLWIQVLTRTEPDLVTLETEFRKKVAAEDIHGYETEIARHPDDAGLRDTAALLYLEVGRAEGAVAHFRASAALQPTSAQARYNLATALTVARQLDEAAAEYRAALRLDPGYANAHNNLGNVLLAQGRAADAVREFSEGARLQPKSPAALANLAAAYAAANQFDRAIETAEAALRLGPDETVAATLRAGIERYRRGVR